MHVVESELCNHLWRHRKLVSWRRRRIRSFIRPFICFLFVFGQIALCYEFLKDPVSSLFRIWNRNCWFLEWPFIELLHDIYEIRRRQTFFTSDQLSALRMSFWTFSSTDQPWRRFIGFQFATIKQHIRRVECQWPVCCLLDWCALLFDWCWTHNNSIHQVCLLQLNLSLASTAHLSSRFLRQIGLSFYTVISSLASTLLCRCGGVVE